MMVAQLPLSPEPFQVWGIMGILAFVIAALVTIVWRLFSKLTTDQAGRDRIIMDFVNDHRSETTSALAKVGDAVILSSRELGGVVARNTAALQELVTLQHLVTTAERLKPSEPGGVVSRGDIETAVRRVMADREAGR